MKPHWRLSPIAASVALMLSATTAVARIETGMTREALVAELGRPEGRLIMGDRAIYRWPTVTVHLRADRVTLVDWRDLAAEEASEKRRANQAAEQQALLDAEEAQRREAAAEAAREAERLRPEREREELRRRVEELEQGERAAREREAELQAQASRERAARLALLRREYWQALEALRKANAEGDEAQAKIWRRIWRSKEAELQSLGGKP